MNWKLLGTMVTLIGVGASVALGQGTAPTIVQGDYISNVFGNSNFIKNPNAKLNTKDVTVSNATVTRSTTTPLVATSEFNITTSTSTGYADWALRTFDGGMKNQNCEARFTYRGFSVGSTTAQILQGTNVVAQLALTASTDPRIASINFPCGDLSAVTKFRLQQASASLTGTNEIGGIYVGLATNMANVAQAEMVGGLTSSSLSSRVIGTANVWTDLTNVSGTVTAIGKATSASTTMSVTFANLPAGEYQVIMNQPFFIYGGSGGHSCRLAILETTSGDRQVIEQSGSTAAAAATYVSIQAQTTARFSFTTAGSRTFKVQVNNNGWTTSANGECYTESSWTGGIFVYRFPSSSELVVTPERQNVFGGVAWSGNTDISTIGATTNTIINTTNFGTPIPFGKASVASSSCGLTANDIGVCFENVPPGTYEVTTSFEQGSVFSFGTAGATACSARIHVSGTSFADTSVASAFTEVGTSGQTDWVTLSSGVVTISSFQPKLALVLKQSKNNGNGRCLIRSSANGTTYPAKPTITFKPLDQPSNSALYVQGPVLSAQTGSTISAGYVGQKLDFTSATISANTTDFTANSTALTTLTPGTWMIVASAGTGGGASTTGYGAFIASGTNNANDQWLTSSNDTSFAYDPNFGGRSQMVVLYYNATTSTPIYAKAKAYGANQTITIRGYAVRLN